MDIELKNAVENSNRLIEAIRSEQKADAEKLAKMEAALAQSLEAKAALEARVADVETKAARPGQTANGNAGSDEHKNAFLGYLRDPQNSAARGRLESEQKAAQITVQGSNGVAIPRVISDTVLRSLVDDSPIRALATVVGVSTTDYVELLDAANAGAVWVGETDARPRTAAPDLLRIQPKFGTQHATIEASEASIQDASFNLEAWLAASISERFASLENEAFVSGDGVNKPLGILHPDAPFEEILTGAADGLGANPHDRIIQLLFGVKAGYRKNGSFVMNSATLASLVSVRGADGNYIYTPALADAISDRILGKSVAIVENMPNIAAGAAAIAFGDVKRGYLVADRTGMGLIVDPYTNPGFVKFTASRRVGGTPRDPQAMKVLRVGA